MKQKKIAFFVADSNNAFPVPAVKGGAVQGLVNNLINKAEQSKIKIDIYSFFDKKSYEESEKYKYINFIWIKVPIIITILDLLFYYFIKCFFKNKKSISYRKVFSLIWYIFVCSIKLKKIQYYKVVLENNIPIAWIIKLSKYKGEYFYHLHNVPRTDAHCRRIFEKCNGFLCVSKFVANKTIKTKVLGQIDRKKFKILYNCIDFELFSQELNKNEKNEIKKKYGIMKNEKIVLFVGRIFKEKGIDKLVEAIKKLNNKEINLLIVGSSMHGNEDKDSFQVNLEKEIEGLDNIIFTGYINQDELYKIYKTADLGVFPSVWEEPAGLTNLEALACGLEIITTNVGGIPEYVKRICTYSKH